MAKIFVDDDEKDICEALMILLNLVFEIDFCEELEQVSFQKIFLSFFYFWDTVQQVKIPYQAKNVKQFPVYIKCHWAFERIVIELNLFD